MSIDSRKVHETIDSWAAAERDGDSDTLRALLRGDFVGIGPRGFQLSKHDWIDRYESGTLVNDEFVVEDAHVRILGSDAAILNAVQVQTAVYRGQASPGRFRITVAFERIDDAWRITDIQLSPMATP